MSFSPRTSPFKRPESPAPSSPSTVRAASPMSLPTKTFQSPSKPSSPMLVPDRQSPFVRRPSQLGGVERPRSPFARPPSRLSVAETPEPETKQEQDPFVNPFVAPSPTPAPRTVSPLQFEAPQYTVTSSPSPPLTTSTPTTIAPAPAPAPAAQSRPAYQRTVTSSTAATVKPTTTRSAFSNVSGYNHIPQPLLRSMRESFEVLDSNNAGSVTSADVSAMLEQLGMDNSGASLSSFFPSNQPGNLNLARFLDTLAGPMAELSQVDELMAAFGAFDVDDSGQIDLHELRDALVHTNPELDGGVRMSERDVDMILGEFAGRRAFGGKGVLGKEIGGNGKRGEVFRYRDFMANISGTGMAGQEGVAT